MMAALRGLNAAALAIAAFSAPSPPNASPIGANIAGIADYGYTMPFIDVTRQSRTWGSASAPWDGNCTTGDDNWPSQSSFGNVFVTFDGSGYSPTVTGNWSVSFNGSAVILPTSLSRGVIVDQVYDAESDSTAATLVMPAQGENDCNCIMISFTNASTVTGGPGIKNLKLLQPGFSIADADKFHPALLQLLSRFDVLRFMDWAATNGNLDVAWSDRVTYLNYSYEARGAPWEVIIDLANTLQVDMHINVPAHANDEYILNLALLLNSTLAPGLAVHVEYSNEVWNWGFEQATYNLMQANESVVLNGDPYHFNDTRLQGVGNPGYWAAYRHAYMVKHIGDIFATVFGRENVGKDARVRPVFAWQCGGHENGFEYLSTIWGPPATFLHSMAAAPYFYPDSTVVNNPNMTVDDFIAGWTDAVANISLSGPYGSGGPNYVAVMAAQASYWGVYLQGYEGGPDTVEGIDTGNALLVKANASIDPRLENIVSTYLQSWASYGTMMRALNYYTAGAGPLDERYGIYTLLTNMTVQDSPKLRGIDDARSTAVPMSPAIPTLPVVGYNGSFYVGHAVPPQQSPFFQAAVKPYMFHAPTPMRVNITVYAGSENVELGVLSITLGGQAQDERIVQCPVSNSWQSSVACETTGGFDLPAGVSTFRLYSVGMTLWIDRMDIVLSP